MTGRRDETLSAPSSSMQMAHLQRRLEESNEVVDAIKTQLVDYKSMVTMLQGQLRRGKGKSGAATGGGAGGSAPSAGRTTGGGGPPEGSVMESGEWNIGDSFVRSTLRPPSGNSRAIR